MTKYQNYNHFKIPITINPLEYGKLIIKIEELDLFIIQGRNTSIFLIYDYKEYNIIKFYRSGPFIFEYKDHKINNNTFIRNLNDKKFTFINNNLTSIEVIKENHYNDTDSFL
jgi:hypothetical protein